MGFFDHLREFDKPNVAEIRTELDKLALMIEGLRPKDPQPPAPQEPPVPAPTPDGHDG